jgi:hypothetical protein
MRRASYATWREYMDVLNQDLLSDPPYAREHE